MHRRTFLSAVGAGAAASLAGCTGEPGSTGAGPITSVDTEIGGLSQLNTLELTVTVEVSDLDSGLHVVVSDPRGNTVGEEFIGEAYLADGPASVGIELDTDTWGDFTVSFVEGRETVESDVVHESTVSISGPTPSIEDVSFESIHSEGGESWWVASLTTTVSNSGDVPAVIQNGAIVADGERTPFGSLKWGVVPGGETVDLTEGMLDTDLTIEEPPTDVTVRLNTLRGRSLVTTTEFEPD